MRPNFADEYKTNIDLLLKVICIYYISWKISNKINYYWWQVVKSIDYYGDDDAKTAKAPLRVLRDILKVCYNFEAQKMKKNI